MGQPSLNGFKLVLQKLQREGHKECVFFCVREEPVVFLRLEGDFVSYTPRGKENLHENLQRGLRAESLEVAIRKEIHDFAQLSESVYYVYNDIERLRDEPHTVRVQCEEDIQVTEEVYRRPVFLLPSYRYHRLPLPTEGAPLEEQFDAFIHFLRESPSLLLRDPGRPPPALLFGCQTGVGRTNLAMAMGTLLLHHHRGAAQKPDFSRWMCRHPELYRLQAEMNSSELTITGDLITKGMRVLVADERFCPDVLSTAKEMSVANFRRVPKMPIYGMAQPSSKGRSAKDEKETRMLQLRSLQYLERYIYLILFNAYLHLEKKDSWQRPFSLWMRECCDYNIWGWEATSQRPPRAFCLVWLA
ncbi:paladin [Limosa lapponica baueri]|uniref:Paladin n=1 Tax=Limosa lapponica baueri TaxID=1758121 RepID=A0A2I0TBD8_LIMLA|nr:paladin [Limosa lapponica baueri]